MLVNFYDLNCLQVIYLSHSHQDRSFTHRDIQYDYYGDDVYIGRTSSYNNNSQTVSTVSPSGGGQCYDYAPYRSTYPSPSPTPYCSRAQIPPRLSLAHRNSVTLLQQQPSVATPSRPPTIYTLSPSPSPPPTPLHILIPQNASVIVEEVSPIVQPSDPTLGELLAGGPVSDPDATLEKPSELEIKSFEELFNPKVVLRPHQLHGVYWAMFQEKNNHGFILADEMGFVDNDQLSGLPYITDVLSLRLGKTIQILALIAFRQYEANGPTVYRPFNITGIHMDDLAFSFSLESSDQSLVCLYGKPNFSGRFQP